MKKLLSLALVLALMLTLGVSAFADVKVDDESKGTGEITVESAAFVSASAAGDDLTVTGDVACTALQSMNDAVNGSGSATITVEGSVSHFAMYAGRNAIKATEGANVTVAGDVTATGIMGNGSALAVDGATVVVGGDVTGSIYSSNNDSVILIEGVADGNNISGYGNIYLGQLTEAKAVPSGHYLIGFTNNELLEEIGFEDKDGFVRGIDYAGVTKSYSFCTVTTDPGYLNGKSVILKPNDPNKTLTVDGFGDADVLWTANENGTFTITLGNDFKGGTQNLVLVLKDKPGPGPDPTPVPVYYVVPTGSVTVVDFTLPDGIEEGLIKVLDSADHAGLTFDKSLLAEGYDHSVKVTLGEEELPEGAYRFVINWDGSLSVILSTTYLKTLGDGSYDFVATVDDLVIPFTVVVAE